MTWIGLCDSPAFLSSWCFVERFWGGLNGGKN